MDETLVSLHSITQEKILPKLSKVWLAAMCNIQGDTRERYQFRIINNRLQFRYTAVMMNWYDWSDSGVRGWALRTDSFIPFNPEWIVND